MENHLWVRIFPIRKVVTFEFVDKILSCDQLNETSLTDLLHGTICFSVFYKVKFRSFVEL